MSALLVCGEIYAIRHIPSGLYMPQTNHGRGYTHLEAAEFIPFGKRVPRLFGSVDSATRALSAWLKGSWVKITDSDIDDWSGRTYTYTAGGAPPKSPPDNRKATEMEIVVFKFEESK